jgi:hypothetical protein
VSYRTYGDPVERQVTVTLATPLGSRILLDQHGSPVTVQTG